MSGNKMTDVKSFDDLNVDSGFQSGVIEYDEDLSGDVIPAPEVVPPKSDDKKVSCVFSGDSGVVPDEMCQLSDAISDINLVEYPTEIASVKPPTIMRPEVKGLPLELLFQQDDDGDTQLHIAAVHGYRKPVITLLRVCPNKELLNVCNDYGQTALHLAVMSQDPVITRMLVLAGADIGIRDRRGDTPLHKATALSNLECMQALLMPVQEHQKRNSVSTVLNQKNYSGQACVHLAATLGHIETLQTLLFYGADINSRENLAGWSALHMAAQRGDTRLVAQIQRCAGAEKRPLDFAGRSPRRFAQATRAADMFTRHEDSDDDSDDDDAYDEEIESLFEKYTSKAIVA